jgi:hypothetical protein
MVGIQIHTLTRPNCGIKSHVDMDQLTIFVFAPANKNQIPWL